MSVQSFCTFYFESDIENPKYSVGDRLVTFLVTSSVDQDIVRFYVYQIKFVSHTEVWKDH